MDDGFKARLARHSQQHPATIARRTVVAKGKGDISGAILGALVGGGAQASLVLTGRGGLEEISHELLSGITQSEFVRDGDPTLFFIVTLFVLALASYVIGLKFLGNFIIGALVSIFIVVNKFLNFIIQVSQ